MDLGFLYNGEVICSILVGLLAGALFLDVYQKYRRDFDYFRYNIRGQEDVQVQV